MKGMATGSGAGGGTQAITNCGAHSRGGSGCSLGCCVSATNGKEGCAVVVGNGSFAGAGMLATGSGAGGGTQTITDCGARSRGGSGYSVGCCVSATSGKEGCAVVFGDGSVVGAGGINSPIRGACCCEMATGSGAGGGARRGACCGASSRGGSGHSVGWCVLSTNMGEG